jgi:formate/nitrite transporter FocA (FNT family)
MVDTGVLSPHFEHQLVTLGKDTMAGPFWPNFWSGVVAGWIIALMAWLVEASDAAVGRFLVVAALAFIVGLGSFDHSIASAAEALATTVNGTAGVGDFLAWLAPVTLGNIVGGVGIVSLVNYGQVRAE